LDHRDQSVAGGPFLWTRHARSRVLVVHPDPTGISRWTGEHDGYRARLGARHARSLTLDPTARVLQITDRVETQTPLPCRLCFHLGPDIDVALQGAAAELTWRQEDRVRTATLTLPGQLTWTAHHGETDPPAGWYSAGFGRKQPAWLLTGTGRIAGTDHPPLVSRLEWQW
jgi:hypothetical protein